MWGDLEGNFAKESDSRQGCPSYRRFWEKCEPGWAGGRRAGDLSAGGRLASHFARRLRSRTDSWKFAANVLNVAPLARDLGPDAPRGPAEHLGRQSKRLIQLGFG